MSAMADEKRKEQIELLKGMLKGAKDDPKGAAIFFRDIAKERWNDPAAREKRDMGKAMLSGAVKDPKGAFEFFKAVAKEERAKRKGA